MATEANKLRELQQKTDTKSITQKIYHVTGQLEVVRQKLYSPPEDLEENAEPAYGKFFLEGLDGSERELWIQGFSKRDSAGRNPSRTYVVARFVDSPWDFAPSETMRPFTITTVSEIAIMARRLGMSWKVFDPERGNMRAEGNGHSIFPAKTSSKGPILQYIRTESNATFVNQKLSSSGGRIPAHEIYIPTRKADMMGFDILPGFKPLQIPCFTVGSFEEVCVTMDILDSSRKASRKLKDIRNLLVGKWDSHCTYGFSDIIPLASPMMHCRQSTIIRLPMPTAYCSSLLYHIEGFVVFNNRLREYISSQPESQQLPQAQWVLEQYDRLKLEYSQWESEDRKGSNRWETEAWSNDEHNLKFLEDVHSCWDTTTTYFTTIEKTHDLHYRDLMAVHISHAVNYWGDAWSHLKNGFARNDYGLRQLETEGMHLYFDYLPSMVADMRRRGFEGDEQLVYEAWFVLVFRAFCWWRCHSLWPGEEQEHRGETVPSRYWDSKLPVYIG